MQTTFLQRETPENANVKGVIPRGEMGKEFSEVRTLECIEREISFARGRTRPSTRVVGHTGFITIARL